MTKAPTLHCLIPHLCICVPLGDAWRDALKDAALTEEEVDLLAAMRARLYRLADAAAHANVKLMVDAEHTYFQPVSGPL